jgi:hypothetical protein
MLSHEILILLASVVMFCHFRCAAGKHDALQLTSASMWTTAALSGVWTVFEATSTSHWSADTTIQQLEHAAPSLLFLGIIATAVTNWLQVEDITNCFADRYIL